MADAGTSPPPSSVDPRSGFCTATRTFHSLRPAVALPPHSQPLSVTSYVFSLLPSPPPSHAAFIDATRGGASLSYPDFLSQVRALAASLRSRLSLSKGDVAFVLSAPRLEIPLLYYALLSIGAVVSPSNPASTPEEISHQFLLTKPSVVFAVSSVAHKLPPGARTVLLDSAQFRSLLAHGAHTPAPEVVLQSDPAAVLYSSGTTGRVKAVVLSHRNLVSLMAYYKATHEAREAPPVVLFTVPLFHVFGFSMLLRGTVIGDTMVLMERFDFVAMLQAVEKHRVTFMPVSPPLIVAMVKSDAVGKHDLSSLEWVGCGGAPLGREVAERFTARFPHVEVAQGYGLTESTGGATATRGPEENRVYGSAGRLVSNVEAKIVDPSTGQALPPGQQGELWLRSPTNMLGYLGDHEATASTLDSEGWLKTGDLCYFNEDGFLFIVDRLKELIKYKAYQVPPAELERILLSHPEIADAAVVPYPDEEAGQIPMAFVMRRFGSSLSGAEVIEFVARQVAPYKKVRRVSFIQSIPKSAAGKILRRELIKHALSGSASKL
uniref:4-coumarate--CoA ligase n=1 Tax=Anthurium amnicola TaxID=1678845 RepID=A0A1D1ZKT5_9ARAE